MAGMEVENKPKAIPEQEKSGQGYAMSDTYPRDAYGDWGNEQRSGYAHAVPASRSSLAPIPYATLCNSAPTPVPLYPTSGSMYEVQLNSPNPMGGGTNEYRQSQMMQQGGGGYGRGYPRRNDALEEAQAECCLFACCGSLCFCLSSMLLCS